MAKISAVSRISAATTDAGVDAQIETTRQRVRVDDARPNLPAPDSRGRFARLRNARARGVGRCALRVANPRNVRSFRDIAKVDFIHPRRPGSRCAFHLPFIVTCIISMHLSFRAERNPSITFTMKTICIPMCDACATDDERRVHDRHVDYVYACMSDVDLSRTRYVDAFRRGALARRTAHLITPPWVFRLGPGAADAVRAPLVRGV